MICVAEDKNFCVCKGIKSSLLSKHYEVVSLFD